MSERSAALGIKAPPKTIEHNGKTFTVAPVLTEGTMLAVEAKFYARAKAALQSLRDEYPPEEYVKQLNELRQRYEDGYYAFESEHTLAALQTTKGSVVLLSAMMTADDGEILDMLTSKPEELDLILKEALADSFPDAPPPKAKAPRAPKRGRK